MVLIKDILESGKCGKNGIWGGEMEMEYQRMSIEEKGGS